MTLLWPLLPVTFHLEGWARVDGVHTMGKTALTHSRITKVGPFNSLMGCSANHVNHRGAAVLEIPYLQVLSQLLSAHADPFILDSNLSYPSVIPPFPP